MDGLSFHPYPNLATDPITRGYAWPNAGVADLGRIKQAVWDAFRNTAQPTTVNGLKLYLDEVGWQVDTSKHAGYSGVENVRVTSERTQARIYNALVRSVSCDPQVAELNFFGFYDDSPRDTGFQAALNRVDGTPRASAGAVQSAIAGTAAGCASARSWYPAKRVIGAVAPKWKIGRSGGVRFYAKASEGATVVACILPGWLGGTAAAAAMLTQRATSPGCKGGKSLPSHSASFVLHRTLPLLPATVAVRVVAEASSLRSRTFSRTLE
jgi:hypothetical protein